MWKQKRTFCLENFRVILFIFIDRFFKIWSNILNYSTPTESITRTNTAAEGKAIKATG